MNKSLLTMGAALLLGLGSMQAGTTWSTKNLGTVTVDTLFHYTIGPGTTQTQLKLSYTRGSSATTSTVTYTTTDLSNEFVTIKSMIASDKPYGKPQTPADMMAARQSYANHYFAAINADFAGLETKQHIPCGLEVENGNFYTGAATLSDKILSNYFVMGHDGVPTIAKTVSAPGFYAQDISGAGDYYARFDGFGSVIWPDGSVSEDLRLNSNDRWDNYLVAYNHKFRHSSGKTGSTCTNIYGHEALLIPVKSPGYMGAYNEYRVQYTASAGDMKIPKDCIVLSGVGDNRPAVANLKNGDIVKIKFPFTVDGAEIPVRDVVGGYHISVKDGEVAPASPWPGDISATTPRARTSVGYTRDKKKVYMAVVTETTSGGAHGLTIVEFGNVMKEIGCYTALNLDGGGSTMMVVENLGKTVLAQDNPTYMRPIANCLAAVTNAPEDRNVARIEFKDKHVSIQPGRGYVPVIYAYNKYGVLISTKLQNYTLSAPEGTATFNSSNRKMIAPSSGNFALTATYNGITATIPIYVTSSGISGVDPSTTATFSGSEFTAVPEKPADYIDPNDGNLYVVGKFNNWSFSNPLVAYPNNGSPNVYEFNIDSEGKTNTDASYFKMSTLDPRTNGGSAAFGAADHAWHTNERNAATPNVLGNNVTLPLLPGNADNITAPWNGKWHYVVDLDKKTINATTTTPRPAFEMPADGIMRLATNCDAADGMVFENIADGVYYIDNADLSDNEVSTFNIATSAASYGPTVNNFSLVKEDTFYPGSNSWSVIPGEYSITVNTNTFTVTIQREYSSPIYAELVDVTPAGYDFDKYTPGTQWKFAPLPATTPSSGTWTAPAGIYTQDAMDQDGHVTALHVRGVNMEDQKNFGGSFQLSDIAQGFTVQKHPNDLVGNCLVFTKRWSPGNSTYDWPYSAYIESPIQLSFYANSDKIGGTDAAHPIRFRMVFQILYRGRHETNENYNHHNEIENVYASAGIMSAWAVSHNGIGDNEIGTKYPADHRMFWRWEGEGQTVASMPAEQVPADMMGIADPWDIKDAANCTKNLYHPNGDRFMVYEYDFYGKPENGYIAVHVNFTKSQSYSTIIIKEVKFYNVVNGEELLSQPRSFARQRVAPTGDGTPFRNNTVYGSLLNTRSMTYRYYTPEGIKEIDGGKSSTTGIDNVTGDTLDGDANAPVEYYNLQGVRVENPTRGLYIRRQGTRATKVIL